MNASPQRTGGFYQFPVCLLAQAIPFPDLLNQCFHYAVCRFLDTTESPKWRAVNKRGTALKKAAATIGFQRGDARHFIENHDIAQRFIESWTLTSGRKTAWVRFRTEDLHFEVRDHRILSERDWRVLAAVYSALGDKEMVRLGWQRIQCRAAGWLTPPPAGAKPCGPLYPRGQIERSLRKLLDRGYLFGATYRRGERWWTNRLKHEQLRAKIAERKLYPAKAAQRRKLDSINDQRIAAALAKLGLHLPPLASGERRIGTPPAIHAAPTDSPPSVGATAVPGPQTSPQFHLIEGRSRAC